MVGWNGERLRETERDSSYESTRRCSVESAYCFGALGGFGLLFPGGNKRSPGCHPFSHADNSQPPPAAAPEDDTSGKVTRRRCIRTCKASKAFIFQAPPGTTADVRSIHFSRGYPSRQPKPQPAAARRCSVETARLFESVRVELTGHMGCSFLTAFSHCVGIGRKAASG